MAWRAPTTPTKYVDTSQLIPQEAVVFTEPDQVADDQQLILFKETCLISDCFYPMSTTTDWPAVDWKRRYFFVGRDLCNYLGTAGGTRTSEDCYFAGYAWSSDGSTDFRIVFYNNNTASQRDILVNASHTTHKWRGYSAAGLSLYCDGNENDIKIGISRDAGTGTVWIAGFFCYSPKT